MEKRLNRYLKDKIGIAKRQLLICTIITAILAVIVIVLEMVKFSESHIAMILGMGLGISTSPLMMEWIKQLRARRRVSKLLKELVQKRQNQNEMGLQDEKPLS